MKTITFLVFAIAVVALFFAIVQKPEWLSATASFLVGIYVYVGAKGIADYLNKK